MKYIVRYPSSGEFGDKCTTIILENYNKLETFLLEHKGDLKRVKVYEATELGLNLVIGRNEDATKD